MTIFKKDKCIICKIYVTISCIPGWFLNPAGLSPPPWRQRIFGRFLAFFLLFLPFHFFWHEPSVAKTKFDQFYLGSALKVFNRYRRKRPKVDTSIFDSALSHNRRSDASKKRKENNVSTFGRFRPGLETCVQAKTSKSGHAMFFSFFRRIRATSMTQHRVENTRVHFWTFSPVLVNPKNY